MEKVLTGCVARVAIALTTAVESTPPLTSVASSVGWPCARAICELDRVALYDTDGITYSESTFVGKSATRQIAQSLSLTVGENATMDVAGNRSASATNDRVEVTDSFEVTLGGVDGPFGMLKMTPKRIVISTEAGAAIILDEDTISLNAEKISLVSKDIDIIGYGKIDQRGGEIAVTGNKTLELTGTGSAKLASTGPTTVNGTPVDNQGMIEVNPELRLSLRYQVQKMAKDGMVALTVVRAGKPLSITLPVPREWPGLLPSLNNGYPPYFVYGPLVFSRATSDYASFMNGNVNSLFHYASIRSPLVTRRTDMKSAEQDELVVISSPFFPHKLAIGYSNPEVMILKSVNGKPVRSLAQLVEYLRDLNDEFISIETDNRGGETLVFAHKDMLAAVEEILNDNGVRAQGSPDMMAI